MKKAKENAAINWQDIIRAMCEDAGVELNSRIGQYHLLTAEAFLEYTQRTGKSPAIESKDGSQAFCFVRQANNQWEILTQNGKDKQQQWLPFKLDTRKRVPDSAVFANSLHDADSLARTIMNRWEYPVAIWPFMKKTESPRSLKQFKSTPLKNHRREGLLRKLHNKVIEPILAKKAG